MKNMLLLILLALHAITFCCSCFKERTAPSIELVSNVSKLDIKKFTCGLADSVLIFRVTNNFGVSIILSRSDYFCGNYYGPGNVVYFKGKGTSELVFDALATLDGAGLEIRDTLIPSQSNYYFMPRKYIEDDFERTPYLILRFPFEYVVGNKEEALEIFLQINEKKNQIEMADTSLLPSDYRTKHMVWGSRK
jgi:hypothetical protein